MYHITPSRKHGQPKALPVGKALKLHRPLYTILLDSYSTYSFTAISASPQEEDYPKYVAQYACINTCASVREHSIIQAFSSIKFLVAIVSSDPSSFRDVMEDA
jgi:hypothetical protein